MFSLIKLKSLFTDNSLKLYAKANTGFFDKVFKLKDKMLFLKIDTQGYEFEVLHGAVKGLNRFQGILVEVSLIELYEGQKSWLEIFKFIQSHGFKLWSVDRGFSNKTNGQTLQLDLCFFR